MKKALNNMKVFSVKCDLLKVEPLFLVNCSFDEMKKYLRKKYRISPGTDDGLPSSGMMLTFSRAPWRVVWVAKANKSSEWLGVAVHEIFHLVTKIMEDKGVPVIPHLGDGRSGDEAAAYTMDFFFRAYFQKI